MYRVLIGDVDEENIRKIKKYIKVNFKDSFKVIKSTETNFNILDVIKRVKPDLFITDVRFCGINSYKIINQIHDEYKDIRFILYGDINDIDYLKHSLGVGTLGYMLKPLKQIELEIYLNTAKNHFDKMTHEKEEQMNLELSYKENINLFESYFINNLLKGVIREEIEISNNFKYFNIYIDNPYTVLTIRVNDFKKKILVMDEEEKHMFIYKILNTVKLGMKDYSCICKINSFNSIVVILGNISNFEDIINICENIKDNVENNDNTKVSIGIGRTYEKTSDIYISFNEAEGALKHKFYMGYSTIIPIQYVEPNNSITYRYPFYKEEKLVHTAVAGEFNYCKNLLSDIFDSLKQAEPLPDRLLSQIVISIIISISRHSSERNVLKEINFSNFFCIDKAMKLKTINEGYSYLYSALEVFCNYVAMERDKVNMSILHNAKEYVENRYYESISLSNISKHLGTTSEYMNKLFLDYENITYYDYVVNKRLFVAKRFLRETDLKDSIIAVNIGYVDERYFKSIFTQYEKMTTDEFRLFHQYKTKKL